jgi:oligoribonuclease (3'-5' exoribonuclease)
MWQKQTKWINQQNAAGRSVYSQQNCILCNLPKLLIYIHYKWALFSKLHK